MNSILDVIKPIKLLQGIHEDTARTGQGCFMNVIAYLNGEPSITDGSPCVCPMIRPLAMFANDRLPDSERQRMLPLLERAMGSRTDDRETMLMRIAALERFIVRIGGKEDAVDAVDDVDAADRAKIIDAALVCLDEMLPPAREPDAAVIERAKALVEKAAT